MYNEYGVWRQVWVMMRGVRFLDSATPSSHNYVSFCGANDVSAGSCGTIEACRVSSARVVLNLFFEGTSMFIRTVGSGVCAFACLALLSVGLPERAIALESFKFVDQKSVEAKEPTVLARRGDSGWAIYDAGNRALLLLSSEYTAEKSIDLRSTIGKHFSEVTALAYNSVLDRLFALDGARKLIYVFERDGRLSRTIDLNITKPVSPGGLTTMAVDASGRIYVGDEGRGDIKVYTTQGQFLFNIVRPADPEGKVHPLNACGMDVMDDGALAVLCMDDKAVLIISRGGKITDSIRLQGKYGGLRDLIVTQAGEFVCRDAKDQKVMKWKVDGTFSAVLGAKGKGRGKFGAVSNVAVTPAGSIVALDRKNANVQVFKFDTDALGLSGRTPSLDYHITHVKESDTTAGLNLVTILDDGLILFDAQKRQVVIRQGDTERVVKHDEFKDVSSGYLGPKRLYVFDNSRNKVFVFGSDDLAFQFEFGGSGSKEGDLSDVVRILPSGNKTLYLADKGQGRVNVFNEDGIFSTRFCEKGTRENEQVGSLSDIAWYQGHIAVLDAGRKMIHVFDENGIFLRNILFDLPTSSPNLISLEVDSNGFLFMLDNVSAQVCVLDDRGLFSFRFGSEGKRDEDWHNPTWFNLDDQNRMTIFDEGKPSRVMVYDVRTPLPISRVQLAYDEGDYEVARKLLKPYTTVSVIDGEKILGYVDAVRLALEVDIVSVPSFLGETKRDALQAYARSVLAKRDDVDQRLALARSLRKYGKPKDAVRLLLAGKASSSDPRIAKLELKCLKDLESAGLARAIVTIDKAVTPPMFAALYQIYFDHPVVSVTLRNEGGKASPAGKLSFFAKDVMSGPTETDVPSIKAFSSVTLKVKTALNRKALTYNEATRMTAKIDVTLGDEAERITLEKNATFQLMERNSMDWSQEQMITCFITPRDPDIQVFARAALKVGSEQTISNELDPNMYKALVLYDALQSVGLYYLPDPRQPFSFSKFASGGVLDYLQFPRETLNRQSGDCDDLSALYAALLEGAGVPTILVTSPGHIFTAFELEGGKQSVLSLGLSEDMLITYQGKHYVPIETTLVGSPFVLSWRVASRIVKTYKASGKIGYIDLQEAWKTYRTVALPPDPGKEVRLPDKKALAELLSRELVAMNLKKVEKRLAVFKEWLAKDRQNLDLLLHLARAYGEVGLFEIAQTYADQAMAVKKGDARVHQVIGNLWYMQNDYTKAVEHFKIADDLKPSAATQVNLALAYLKGGQLLKAREAFANAKKMDSDFVSKFGSLGSLLD